MISIIQRSVLKLQDLIEAVFTKIFGDRFNPLFHLGALSFYFFWIVVVSGLYLFIFFDTSLTGAYETVEYLTVEQWYFGGVMRSFHRYASDAMAVTVTWHLIREFAKGRFRGVRWFSWFSGVPLLWLLFACGIGGYWLVWDQMAQYVAIVTSEWLDWLPFFSDPLARNFLTNETLSDRLFSLLVFIHIALSLFLLLGMFIHIKRIKLAKTDPPKALAIGTLVAFLVLSLIKPAVSMGPVDIYTTVANVDLDWFYMNFYPLIDSWGPGAVWGLLVGLSFILSVMPWLPFKQKKVHQVAVIEPQNCNGCGWCFEDCPYGAITMTEHPDKNHRQIAVVESDLCVSCGICVGSCPSATPFRHIEELVSGIELPDVSIDWLRKTVLDKVTHLEGDSKVIVFGCENALALDPLEENNTAILSLPCIGLLPPSFVDFVARQDNVDGVFITGCYPEDCFHRKGSLWTEERFSSKRMPHLRTEAAHQKVKVFWAGPLAMRQLKNELNQFKEQLVLHSLHDKKEQDNDSFAAKKDEFSV